MITIEQIYKSNLLNEFDYFALAGLEDHYKDAAPISLTEAGRSRYDSEIPNPLTVSLAGSLTKLRSLGLIQLRSRVLSSAGERLLFLAWGPLGPHS